MLSISYPNLVSLRRLPEVPALRIYNLPELPDFDFYKHNQLTLLTKCAGLIQLIQPKKHYLLYLRYPTRRLEERTQLTHLPTPVPDTQLGGVTQVMSLIPLTPLTRLANLPKLPNRPTYLLTQVTRDAQLRNLPPSHASTTN